MIYLVTPYSQRQSCVPRDWKRRASPSLPFHRCGFFPPNESQAWFHAVEDRWAFYLILQLATGGELMDRIIAAQHFSERVASAFFKQMLLGVKHCHDHGVVHRDLKPENFLLESKDPNARLLLSDFGLSSYIPTPDHVITDACGSAYYIAPEVFTRRYTKVRLACLIVLPACTPRRITAAASHLRCGYCSAFPSLSLAVTTNPRC